MSDTAKCPDCGNPTTLFEAACPKCGGTQISIGEGMLLPAAISKLPPLIDAETKEPKASISQHTGDDNG